jgi:hypothetical protein
LRNDKVEKVEEKQMGMHPKKLKLLNVNASQLALLPLYHA